MLLVLGLSSLVSILATGALIDRHLRTLTLAACGLLAFATAVLAAALLTSVPWARLRRRHALGRRGGRWPSRSRR
ncbi:hypothetical protein ACWC9Q_37320 [Streptomyces sp. NPDC001142]